jgi:hypothetical protein
MFTNTIKQIIKTSEYPDVICKRLIICMHIFYRLYVNDNIFSDLKYIYKKPMEYPP